MRLRTITETPLKPTDQVFRQSRIMWLIGTIIASVFLAGGLGIIRKEPTIGWPFAAIAALVALPFAYIFAITYRSENWVVRYRAPHLLIKFRSYMNRHLADDDPVILELDTSEIAWVRKVRARISTQLNPMIFLDIKLKAGDLSQLKQQLAAEAQRGKESFRFGHDPVMLLSDGILRVEWRGGGCITPNVDRAIAMLHSAVPIGAPDETHTHRPVYGRQLD